jgi:hypothetical protein
MPKESNEIRHITELVHYEDRPERFESPLFRKIKAKYKKSNTKCYINNKYCSSGTPQAHHILEYSFANSLDWEKLDFDNIDSEKNFLPLCKHHHTDPMTGIHSCTYPVFISQKWLDEDALDDFENAIKKYLEENEK